MDTSSPPDSFFAELLYDTDREFRKSSVFKKQLQLGQKWNYAVCATPIQKERGVIFGINWGGTNNFQPQSVMPSGHDIASYHFIKQSKQFLEKNLGLDIASANFNYTNLCFFRTPKANILSSEDYRLSLPLFEKYIRYINPPWLLSIGSKNLKELDRMGVLRNIHQHYDNQNKFKGHSGILWEYNIFSVPHPSARLSNDARQTIWLNVTAEMKKLANG